MIDLLFMVGRSWQTSENEETQQYSDTDNERHYLWADGLKELPDQPGNTHPSKAAAYQEKTGYTTG